MATPRPAAQVFRPRLLVTADMSEEGLAALRELGDVDYASFRRAMRILTGGDLVEALRGVHVFITEVDLVDAEALAHAPDVRVIAACRGDAVNVDFAACTAFGVPVLNAPGRNADAVADLTLAFLLMLARKLPAATAFLREPGIEAGDLGRMGMAFTSLQGRELWRKTIGLVGFGAVGHGVARRAVAFGARVLVHDPYLPDDRSEGVERATLGELLAQSDFVSLHAAVTDETRGLIGAAELARMKPGAFLVNTARAALVDEDALAAALRSGHLAGAALDVFSTEPPGSAHPLLALDSVIATPHVGGNTVDVATHQGEIIAADLRRLLAGARPHHVVNPEVLPGFDWTAPRRAPMPEALAALGARPGPAVSDLQRDRGAAKVGSGPTAPAPATTARAASPVAERMNRVLDEFLRRVGRDDALGRFATGKDVTLHFALPDMGRTFHLRLRDGKITAAPGEPDAPADVELGMRAVILDGMFTGSVNPMQAATGGLLSFRGDTMKAMTLQHIQADLARCYVEVRGELGDPGDLGALGGAALLTRTSSAVPADADDVRRELIQVVNELYAAELITATGGNVSARIPGTETLWITPSQLFKGDLRPEILVRIDLDGNVLDEGALSPSSERLMHCAVYRARPDAGAVIHAHAAHATILANTGLPFLPISTEAAFFGDIPRLPFIMPGTDELASAVGGAVTASWAVMMQNHGLLVAGRSLRRAADMAEIVERSAEVILGCYAVGKEPPVLPADVVTMLRRLGDLVA